MKLKKHYEGCYRISFGDVFGQIKKVRRSQWQAEVRDTQTGQLIRYAGLWNTRREAIEELNHINKQMN